MTDQPSDDINPEEYKNMPWAEFLGRTYGSLFDDEQSDALKQESA